MYSNENDFTQCCEIINKQKNVNITHVVISNLPEKIAHNKLWDSWDKEKYCKDYTCFIKIDADTVLHSEHTIETIGNYFKHSNRLTGMQCYLHDYYSDELIFGLNCFSPAVKFQKTTDDLYCDRNVDVNHDIVLRGNQLSEQLIPAGFHCHNSSDIQSFHYGYHRALKNKVDNLNKVKLAYDLKRDRKRAFVLLGADNSKLLKDKFNYTDPEFVKLFQNVYDNFDKLKLEL